MKGPYSYLFLSTYTYLCIHTLSVDHHILLELEKQLIKVTKKFVMPYTNKQKRMLNSTDYS